MNLHERFDWDYLIRHLPGLLEVSSVTMRLFALAASIAMILGLFLAIGRLRRGPISFLSAAYVEVFRNTPLLLQLYFVFFALPLLGLRLSPFIAGVTAIAAQHTAFFAEVYRGAIQSIVATQYEAARALGMRQRQILRLIVLPQAIRDAIPPMGNNFVLLLLDTSLVSTISVMEITLKGFVLAERSAASVEIFVGVAAVYLLLTASIGAILRIVEGRTRVRR